MNKSSNENHRPNFHPVACFSRENSSHGHCIPWLFWVFFVSISMAGDYPHLSLDTPQFAVCMCKYISRAFVVLSLPRGTVFSPPSLLHKPSLSERAHTHKRNSHITVKNQDLHHFWHWTTSKDDFHLILKCSY